MFDKIRSLRHVLMTRFPAILAVSMLCACGTVKSPSNAEAPAAISATAVDMNAPLDSPTIDGPIQLHAAKNEWISFCVEVAAHGKAGLRLAPPQAEGGLSIDAGCFSAYQVLSLPVDTDRAGYIRQTGVSAGVRRLPRALLPLRCDNGVVDLTNLRNSDAAPLIWVDLHVPPDAVAGQYQSNCQIVSSDQSRVASSLGISLQVYDFALPDDRHLSMVSQIDWDALMRLYPDRFEGITPRLIHRADPLYNQVVATLDQFVSLAQSNRTNVNISRLQPTVKWPVDQSPQIDWSDFDSLISPWMSGEAFPDKTPLSFWPLPQIDYLANYDPQSQRDYWSEAASHFNTRNWLDRAAAVLTKRSPGKATLMEAIELSAQGRTILDAHPLIRIALPLEDDQLRFIAPDNPALLDPDTTSRMLSCAPGLVFAVQSEEAWPQDVRRPEHWLRTDVPGLLPYDGAGANERDVRLWAWLAYLQDAQIIFWSDPLPDQANPNEPADPSKLTWFYPGSWFGMDEPIPSIQLKWLRRAQQDYEYLLLAEQRGMRTEALMLARLIVKQVELQPGQSPDPEYGLLSGTIDQSTWDQAQSLLARAIQLRPPSASPQDLQVKQQENNLNLDTIRWQQPKERPFIVPRTVQWLWGTPLGATGDHWASVRLGVDIYNAGDNRPQQNDLQWTGAGDAWQITPQPIAIGALRTYGVQRFSLDARVDLDRVSPDSRKPAQITYVDGYTRNAYPTQIVLPVAVSAEREGSMKIDASLDDWSSDDLIHDGPLTRMLDRPSVQHWRVELSSATSRVYTAWSGDDFYVAFRINALSAAESLHRNFVNYDSRRAWGEDACEILIQPIGDDNGLGPVTYLACKPSGVCMVRRRLDARTHADPWHLIDGAAVRFAADPADNGWSGELAIPWDLILGDNPHHPRLLRFNFIQHVQASGESASWAGPIDADMDDSLMGLLVLRELSASSSQH
jgi:Domain of unknown function (DUF4091)